MNQLGYDAMTFGNLEFLRGNEVLASYLEQIEYDAVSANLNLSEEADLQRLVNRSIIKTFGNNSVGIIGYGTEVINDIAVLGNAYFEDPIESIQSEVEQLESMGINKIIVLGHSWGYFEDTEAAEIAQIPGVDILVLGGLNLYQCSCCPPRPEDVPGEYAVDKYHIVITQEGESGIRKRRGSAQPRVLVVHGYPDARQIGRLNVIFTEDGQINEWYGGPIRLENEVEQDPDLLAEIIEYGEPIKEAENRDVGSANVFLQGSPRGQLICRREECNLGNLIADAMYWACVEDLGEDVLNTSIIAVMNSGGIRASIDEGDIVFSDVKDVLPFGNTFDSMELEGRYVRELLEHAVSVTNTGRFLQISGMKVTYDLCQDPYDGRVNDVMILKCLGCQHCYYEPLDDDRVYKVVLPSFIGGGGDGYGMVAEQGENYQAGNFGEEVLADYIEQFSPVERYTERRIYFSTEPCELPSTSAPDEECPPCSDATSTVPTEATTEQATPTVITSAKMTSPKGATTAQSGGGGGGGGRDKPRKGE